MLNLLANPILLLSMIWVCGCYTTLAAPTGNSLVKRAEFGQSAGPHIVFTGGPGDINPDILQNMEMFKDTGSGELQMVEVVGLGDGSATPTVYDRILSTDAPDAFKGQNILDGVSLNLTFTNVDVDKFKAENKQWGYQVTITYFASMGPDGDDDQTITSPHYLMAYWGA